MSIVTSVSQIWRRLMLRGTAFGGAYRKVRLLYAIQDPWEMESTREQHRFQETMAHLKSLQTSFDAVLELGCGEGHQSLHFTEVCRQLYGVDISALAVRRAKERCPIGIFQALPLEDVGGAFSGQRFDLITACEVLYYVEDISSCLTTLKSRADRIYVSNYGARAEMMRRYFSGDGWRQLTPIIYEDIVWECAVWEAPNIRKA